jgi:hypothetical protein
MKPYSITDASYFTFNVDNSIFLTGQTGVGKSEFVRRYMRRIEGAYSPDEMRYVIFDLKRVEFSTHFAHDGAPNKDGAKQEYLYRDVILDPILGLDVLEELAELAENRVKEAITQPFIFIYIEECDMALIDQERFSKAVTAINKYARQTNMKLIYSTSRPGPDVIPKSLLDSFDLIIAGELASDTDYEYLGVPKPKDWEQFSFIVVNNNDSQHREQ